MADEEKPEQAAVAAKVSDQGCPVEMYEERRCGRPIYTAPAGVDEKPVCLMHSKDPKKDDAAFQAEFERILGSAGEDIADFSKFVFPECKHPSRSFRAKLIFWKAEFLNDADFADARFAGRTVFSGARFMRDGHFLRAHFDGEAQFYKTRFEGVARFTDGVFKAQADFSLVSFNGRAFFCRAAFEGHVGFERCKFAGYADFALAGFLGQARFILSRFEEYAGFVAAKFSGYAGFDRVEFLKEVHFGGCKFDSRVNFEKAIFGLDADFNASEFTEGVFIASKFLKYADFSSAKFTGQASFIVCTFGSRAKFESAKFLGDADFTAAKFGGRADFRRAWFQGKANLKEALFTGEVRFDKAVFTLEADFSSARFETAAIFRETQLLGDPGVPGLILTSARFERPDTVIFDNVYLDATLLHKCDVSKFGLSDVRWRRRKNGKCMAFDEVVDLRHPAARALVPQFPGWASFDERNYGLIAEVYQQLKKNYDDRRDYWTAGDWHYGEMEMKRLSSPRRNKFLRWLHRNLGLVALYRYASEYGENYVLPALWLLVLLLGFAMLYPLAGLTPGATGARTAATSLEQGSAQVGLAEAYSGPGIMTTVGVAFFQRELAYVPSYPWGRLLSWFQLLLTYTLVALFLLALRRQFRR